MLILRHIGDKTTLSLLICKNDSVIATLVTLLLVTLPVCSSSDVQKRWTGQRLFPPFAYYNEEGIVTDLAGKYFTVGLCICSNSLCGDA